MSDDLRLENEMTQVLKNAYLRIMRIEPQLRRFARAMADLGAPVPSDWATQADGTEAVEFGTLTPKQFDRLLCLMEDLAAGRSVTVTVTRGGPSLFHPGAASGPVAPPTPSSVHMVMPR